MDPLNPSESQQSSIVLNSPPTSPRRQMSSSRLQWRLAQEQLSPTRERRRSSQSPSSSTRSHHSSGYILQTGSGSSSPVYTPPLTPSPRDLSPISAHHNMSAPHSQENLIHIPPPVEVCDQTPIPTQYQISQLYAQYNALPPLQLAVVHGRHGHPVTIPTQTGLPVVELDNQVPEPLGQQIPLPVVELQQPAVLKAAY